jgi:phosphoglucosamine mutase
VGVRFGTDGVRGLANVEITPELAMALGRAASRVLGGGASHARVMIGVDSRRSGAMLAGALSAGIASEGLDVIDLGVVPTPAVALAAQRDNVVGAMISASHNPFADNGIKFFAPGGTKLPDAVEAAIEAELHALLSGSTTVGVLPTGDAVGRVRRGAAYVTTYVDHLVAAIGGRRLDGLRVVLDTANGATWQAAPLAFRALGAEVMVIHDAPDGTNINDRCGSTHPESLQEAVRERGADVGFAFDGDADRMLAVDASGTVVDGDQILAMLAVDRRERGLLPHDTVVVTVMTNLGFRLAMAERGVNVVDTAVGDRYVLEAMLAGGFVLGGEQSGHVINADLATTGDGTLSALLVADLMVRAGRPLADLGSVMTRLPQVLRNVKGVDRSRLDGADELWADVRSVEAELAGQGRVLLRPSGTEALVRVMVEAPTQDLASAAASRLCSTVERVLGQTP